MLSQKSQIRSDLQSSVHSATGKCRLAVVGNVGRPVWSGCAEERNVKWLSGAV